LPSMLKQQQDNNSESANMVLDKVKLDKFRLINLKTRKILKQRDSSGLGQSLVRSIIKN